MTHRDGASWSGAVLCGGASRRMGRDKALIEIDGVPMARRVADALAVAGAAQVIAVGGDAPALRAAGLTVVADDPALVGRLRDARPSARPDARVDGHGLGDAGPGTAVTSPSPPTAPADRGPRSDAGPGTAAASAGAAMSPGPAGPLVGVVTALGELSTEVVLVVACDLVHPSAEAMAATVAALRAAPDADLAVPLDGDERRQWLHAAWRRAARPRLVEQLAEGERSIHRAVAAGGLAAVTIRDLPAAVLNDADVPGQLPRQAD